MKSVKKSVYSAVFAALIAVLTMFVRISLISGYINLGDVMIIVACYCIGYYALPAAAVGSAIADLYGYPAYAPVTFVVKLLMATGTCLVLSVKKDMFFTVLASVICELIMVLGYFAYEYVVFGATYAIPNLPANLGQAVVAVVLGPIVVLIVKKLKLTRFMES